MSNYLNEKVIVVTGAAGFGQLACEKTAVHGARIAAEDINSEAQHVVVDGIVGNERKGNRRPG